MMCHRLFLRRFRIRAAALVVLLAGLTHRSLSISRRIITIASPGDSLGRGSASTAGSDGRGGSPGVSAPTSRNSAGISRGSGLSARSDAFPAASAAAQDAAGSGSGSRHGLWQRQQTPGHSGGGGGQQQLPPRLLPGLPSGSGHRLSGQQLHQQQQHWARDAAEDAFARSMSVRVDAEAEIDEEDLLHSGIEILAETWMIMEYCDR